MVCPVAVCPVEGSPVLSTVETWVSFPLEVDAGVVCVVRAGFTVTCFSPLPKEVSTLISLEDFVRL